MRSIARWSGTALAVLVGIAAPATPAFGHGGPSVPDAAFYRTEIAEGTPVPGVSARVDPAGEWLELTYTGGGTVLIYGYLGEPYLRVTAAGSDENSAAPSTYLNRSLFADTAALQGKAADVAPVWSHVAAAGQVRWHDHRIHWMGQSRPAVVNADPVHPHQVGTWLVRATVDGAPFEVHGTLRWIGKPGSVVPIVLIVVNSVLLLGGCGYFWWSARRRRVSPPVPAAPR